MAPGDRRRFWGAFLMGMGSVLDLGGTLAEKTPVETGTTPAGADADREALDADREALAADWQAVADDFWAALRALDPGLEEAC